MGKQKKQWLTIFLGFKITADGDCSHKIRRCSLLGRKVMTNLDSILKSRDITLPTKVRLVKAMVFPTLCISVNSILPGSTFHGILQARILEWVAISGDPPKTGIEPGSVSLWQMLYPFSHQGKYKIKKKMEQFYIISEPRASTLSPKLAWYEQQNLG